MKVSPIGDLTGRSSIIQNSISRKASEGVRAELSRIGTFALNAKHSDSFLSQGRFLFTIRNYVAPASELAEQYEGFTDELLHSIETAPEEMQEYKGWVGVAETIRAELN